VFSLQLYAFLLLLLWVALVIVGTNQLFGGTGLGSKDLDHMLSISLVVAYAAYLYSATGTFYGARGGIRALKVVVLKSVVACTVLGYRFALLLITLYST
jgi:hypothetical protein